MQKILFVRENNVRYVLIFKVIENDCSKRKLYCAKNITNEEMLQNTIYPSPHDILISSSRSSCNSILVISLVVKYMIKLIPKDYNALMKIDRVCTSLYNIACSGRARAIHKRTQRNPQEKNVVIGVWSQLTLAL